MAVAAKPPRVRRARQRGFGIPTALGIGARGLWLSIIVMLPSGALVASALGPGLGPFWDSIPTESAIPAFDVTFLTSAVVTVINAVVSLQIAWTLTGGSFPGRRFVDALIDLPFALPTIVASIVLPALYGATSPVGIHVQQTKYGVMVALLFVTLPFVVRSVEPVLLEIGTELEGAAMTLGANALHIFRRITLPAIRWGLGCGMVLTAARGLGEFGAVILVSSN